MLNDSLRLWLNHKLSNKYCVRRNSMTTNKVAGQNFSCNSLEKKKRIRASASIIQSSETLVRYRMTHTNYITLLSLSSLWSSDSDRRIKQSVLSKQVGTEILKHLFKIKDTKLTEAARKKTAEQLHDKKREKEMVLITVEELSIKALGYISVDSRSETRLLGQQPDVHSSHDT